MQLVGIVTNRYLEKIASSLGLRALVGAKSVARSIGNEARKLSPGNLRLDKEYLGTGGMLKNIAKNRVAQVGAGVAAGALAGTAMSNKKNDQ